MKLWGDDDKLLSQIERFTVGNDPELDLRLVPYDCLGSMAHARMLATVGLLEEAEAAALVVELREIIRLAGNGEFIIEPGQEDCHTAIEQHLIAKLGDVGKKLHTGRSRNDQVLTALRLYYKDALTEFRARVQALAQAIKSFARSHKKIPLPGYTHTRKAMPSSVRMWAEGLSDSLKDDLDLLKVAARLIDQSPLGTGAGYGVPLPLDRKLTAKLLGFKRVQQNPVYVQSSRGKFEAVMLHAVGQVLLDLNRVAADLVFFSMPEFGYFKLPTHLCTGSSIMPQKQNPDVLELVRAKYNEFSGAEWQLRQQMANLIQGYHRDLQLTKEPVFKGLDIGLDTVAIMTLVFQHLGVDAARCKAAMTPELYATEEAYRLVQQGVPFRDAYLETKKRHTPKG